MLWDRSVQCNVFDYDNNHIDVHIMNNDTPMWSLTGFYGFLERNRRKDLWKLIKSLASKSLLPLILMT